MFYLIISAITACQHAADIAFVVDTSTDVSYQDFQKMKDFLIAVEKRFRIAEFGSRHGVIVHGSRAQLLVRLNGAQNSTEFVKAVDSLWRIGGQRASYRALEIAENVLFDFGNGARRNAPKVVVMVTAGGEAGFSNSAYLNQVAKRLRDRGVVVKVVGIGSALSRNALLPLVASSADLYRPSSVDGLKDETPALSDSICMNIGMYVILCVASLQSCLFCHLFSSENKLQLK